MSSSKLWPTGPVCPHCGSVAHYKLTPKEGSKRPVRPGVYKCKDCRKQYTVRIGTIFEDSHLPFSKWLMALHLMTSSKKGISSLQISRELDITLKSAWFMTHRIREAMIETFGAQAFTGTVEVDETYVGGKPRNHKRRSGFTGRGTKKTPVVVLVQRDGKAACNPIGDVTIKTLREEMERHIDKNATIMTDEYRPYRKATESFEDHKTVCHSKGEYARKEKGGFVAHTNTAESFFALLKRGHYGIFHQLSKKHLHRYTTEFGFRWNHRKCSDGERMVAAIRGAEGKRLTYKQPRKASPTTEGEEVNGC